MANVLTATILFFDFCADNGLPPPILTAEPAAKTGSADDAQKKEK